MCNGCDASLKAGSTRLAVGLPKCISLAVTYVVGVNMSGMSICGCLWIAFGVLWLVWALRSKPTQMRESLGSRFSHVVATVAAFYAMFSGDVPLGWMHTRVVPRGPWIEALGIALTVAGIPQVTTKSRRLISSAKAVEMIATGSAIMVRPPTMANTD